MPSPKDRPNEFSTAFVAAILGLLVAFGVPLTDTQTGAILIVVGFIPALVTWIVELRRKKG